MIIFLIILLAVIIIALFIDWSALSQKLPRRGTRPAKSAPVQSMAQDPQDRFSMEDVPLDEPTVSSTNSEVEKMLAEADIHFRKGEMKAAEKLYLQAAADDPRCSKAYSRLGVIYLENGEEWEDAEAAFRQALKYDPQNGFILNNLGLVLYHQDRYADAIRNFEQSVRQDEQNAARHSNLGMAYMAMRQYAKAESSFKKALKLAPNEMEYKDLLAEAMEKKSAHKAMLRK